MTIDDDEIMTLNIPNGLPLIYCLSSDMHPVIRGAVTFSRRQDMGTPVIRTASLSKRYGKVSALSDLDLELGEGEVLGYLGPNGAGKLATKL